MNNLLAVIPAFPLVALVLGAIGLRLGVVVYNSNQPITPTKSVKASEADETDADKQA
jgi:xanthosine utilization system XapX-like protein